MAFCRRCGSELKEGAEFCPHCGAPVSGPYSPSPRGPAPVPPAAEPPKKGIPTVAVLAALVAVMLVGIFALNSLLPTPEPPQPAPEGGYDVTFSLQDTVISAKDDTLLNMTSDGKYYDPLTGTFSLASPSNLAEVGLQVNYGKNLDTELDIRNTGKTVLSAGTSGPVSAGDICTVHLDKDAGSFHFSLFLVTAFEKKAGHHIPGSVIDMGSGDPEPAVTGVIDTIVLGSQETVREYAMSGDLQPYASSGKVIVKITPVP